MDKCVWHDAAVFHLGDVVRKLRLQRKLRLEDLQEATGIDKGTLSDLERGVGKPRLQTLEKVAEALKVEVPDLYRLLRTRSSMQDEADLDETDVSGYKKNDIPVVAEGEANPQGSLFWTDEGLLKSDVEDRISRPRDVKDPQAYAVRVRGDSMAPAYRPGTLLVVSPNTPVKSGDEVYVQLLSGERLLKVAHKQDGGWVLESYNPAHPPRFVAHEEIGAIHPIMWARRRR